MNVSFYDSTPTVMVVDDQRVNRELLRSILNRSGYNTIVAANGAEALELLTAPPDVVLLDVVMPDMDGFECLWEIRERFSTAELPVIMATGQSDQEMVVSALQQGANDYITKPIDPAVLSARIDIHVKLRRATLGLQKSEERYALAALGSNVGLYDWDLSRNHVYLSPRWKEMLGYGADELEPEPTEWLSRIHHDDVDAFRNLVRDGSSLEECRIETEFRMRHRNRNYRWMRCTGILKRDGKGRSVRLAGSLADVTEGKVRDPLTGLPNRLLFDDRLDRAVHRANGMFAVLFLDLDNFKLVNDSLGHQIGDQLLVSVASRIETALMSRTGVNSACLGERTVARLGGDEFAVLLEEVSGREAAEEIAGGILDALANPHQLAHHEVCAPGSIGIAIGEGEAKTASDLMREADTAMYHAKSEGRARCRVFDPEMQQRASKRMRLERDLRKAIKLEEFYLQYQPVVELRTEEVDRFEVLTRWRHPRNDSVNPSTFIAVAEDIGLISSLGSWVFEAACRQAVAWGEQFPDLAPPKIAVNVSIRELHNTDFLECLKRTITETGITAECVEVEITETTLMSNPSLVRDVLSRVREVGVRIAVDDFGTGYSSLAYLHRMPLDVLKIDQSFIAEMQQCKESLEIVRTIVTLGLSLGLEMVAEGVETPDQRDTLVEIGCTHAQGYLYSAPTAPDAAIQLWRRLPAEQSTEISR